MFSNAYCLPLDEIHWVFKNDNTSLPFIQAGAYLALVFDADVRKRKEVRVANSLQHPISKEVPLLFRAVKFIDVSKNIKDWQVHQTLKNRTRIAIIK